MLVNLDTDYKRNTKLIPGLISKVLPCTATFKLGLACRNKTHEMIFFKTYKVPHSYKLRRVLGPAFKGGLKNFFRSGWKLL